jgi:hypothetical protein
VTLRADVQSCESAPGSLCVLRERGSYSVLRESLVGALGDVLDG